MNARGAMRGRGRSASVPKDGVYNRMNRAELMKTQPCHGCGEYGHWYRQCPYRTNQVNVESNFSNGETNPGDLIQFDQGGNVSQTVSPNLAVP